MSNVALAAVLDEDGAQVVFALCAPAEHQTIWRRWAEATTAFSNQGKSDSDCCPQTSCCPTIQTRPSCDSATASNPSTTEPVRTTTVGT